MVDAEGAAERQSGRAEACTRRRKANVGRHWTELVSVSPVGDEGVPVFFVSMVDDD